MNKLQKCPAVRVRMFPKDTNATGTNIFGGVILSHMDIAGSIAAQEVTNHRVFPVSFDKVVFKSPVHIGDVLTCWSEVIRTGRTSITTRIIVEAQRKGTFIPVTEGEAVFVAVDSEGRPTPIADETSLSIPAASSCGSSCSHSGSFVPEKTGKTDRKSKAHKKSKKQLHKCPALRIGMLPKDTSTAGTNISAGVILSHMDIAGVIAAREVTSHRVVTVSFDKVVFKRPVHVGDVLTCWSEATKVGRTSITTRIIVQAQRKGVFIPVTEGEAVYVAVGPDGRPVPLKDKANPAPVAVSNCGPTCGHSDKPAGKNKKNKVHGKKKSKKKDKKAK